jgi:ubiquinone/menaquinone biosynthesis C-methylase UbiE
MNQALKQITRLFPTPVYIKSREAMLGVLDGIDWVAGRREALIPPRRLMLDGPASIREFKSNGQIALKLFRELAGLKPGASVLDVGSGMGRKTLPLIEYLGRNGRYEGIDIFEPGITWCQEHINRDHPNFRFQLLDVYNKYYNPGGQFKASEIRFPFENHSFDFVILTSVFTHMLPDDIAHYLSEIKRVSKPGATSYISYFLLNPESSKCLQDGVSKVAFRHQFGHHRVEKLETPEDAICLSEEFVRRAYAENGLALRDPISYGSWCGRGRFVDYQDIVIAESLA